jgi:hypothetical protein
LAGFNKSDFAFGKTSPAELEDDLTNLSNQHAAVDVDGGGLPHRFDAA